VEDVAILTAQSFFECELRNARHWEDCGGSYVDEMLAGQFPNGSSGRDAFSLAYYPPNHGNFDILPGSTQHIDMLLDLPLPFTEPERRLLGTELVDSMRTELSLRANLLVSYTEQDMMEWRLGAVLDINLPAINLAEPAPTGHDGVEISVGDRVRVVATGDIFRVDDNFYLGYVNREVAEEFNEPGWMLNCADQDHGGQLVNAGDCVKI
jgi:hypothetical protein